MAILIIVKKNFRYETEELLIGKTIEFKYPEGLLKDDEINMKLIVIN